MPIILPSPDEIAALDWRPRQAARRRAIRALRDILAMTAAELDELAAACQPTLDDVITRRRRDLLDATLPATCIHGHDLTGLVVTDGGLDGRRPACPACSREDAARGPDGRVTPLRERVAA